MKFYVKQKLCDFDVILALYPMDLTDILIWPNYLNPVIFLAYL